MHPFLRQETFLQLLLFLMNKDLLSWYNTHTRQGVLFRPPRLRKRREQQDDVHQEGNQVIAVQLPDRRITPEVAISHA